MFEKGKCANPKGRPKGIPQNRYRALLDRAIGDAEKKHDQSLLDRALEMAWADSSMMTTILKKILPDMKQIEVEAPGGHEAWLNLLDNFSAAVASKIPTKDLDDDELGLLS